MAKRNITDPVETVIAAGLDFHQIEFLHESENKAQSLDFYLPGFDLFIECKRFATPRTAEQIGDRTNVILVQGLPAAEAFVKILFAVA